MPPPTLLAIAMALGVLVGRAQAGLCPARCRCDDEALRGSCTYGSLDIVPIQLNPELRHLDLAGNRISGLRMAFDFYRKLESLDLNSNLIHTLGSNNFQMQDKLLTLNLSYNSLATIAKGALHGLTTLRVLDLSNNNITDLDEQAFRYTSELEKLDLNKNAITSFPDGLLRNLHRIRWIELSHNSILEVPTANLALVPSLERLDLSDNLIQELTGTSLPSLPSLDHLNLASNVIRFIADDAFDRVPGLLHLDLSGNNLTVVPSNALAKMSILTTLVLNRNPLAELKNFAFRNLFELRTLQMNECSLAQVQGRAFADNVNLERISMDGNRELTELPDRVLYAAGNLRWVSLRRCSLRSLQPTQFPVDGLYSLHVGGNPIVCNCSVHWLWNVLRSELAHGPNNTNGQLDIDASEIVCADEEFAGKILAQLPEGALRCKLDPLLVVLIVVVCLVASAGVLAVIAKTRQLHGRKLGAPSYAPAGNGVVSRPELLVYVGRQTQLGGEIAEKNAESYSRRLIAAPGGDSPTDVNNFYETPRYSRPSPGTAIIGRHPEPYGSFFIQQQHFQQNQIYHHNNRNNHLHGHQLPSAPQEENVYAVADVTDLRDDPPPPPPPEIMSLYRMQKRKIQANGNGSLPYSKQPSAPQATLTRDYDYEYEYNNYRSVDTTSTTTTGSNTSGSGGTRSQQPPPLPPNKPQVVFV